MTAVILVLVAMLTALVIARLLASPPGAGALRLRDEGRRASDAGAYGGNGGTYFAGGGSTDVGCDPGVDAGCGDGGGADGGGGDGGGGGD